MKIAVTGYPGQLASEIKDWSSNYPQFDFDFFTRDDWDIASESKSQQILQEGSYDVLINCAAYTQVDLAEKEVEAAKSINTDAVQLLSLLCAEKNIHLIHISTDYIYGSNVPKAVNESSDYQPANVYASTKLKGELSILKSDVNATIIRTSWVYSRHGHNFIKTMLKLLSSKEAIRVVNDQWGCPTHAKELAFGILKGIETQKFLKEGVEIYNYTERGWTNWYEMVKEIQVFLKSSCTITPIPTLEYPTPAKRPKYSFLDCSKMDELDLMERKHWKEALKDCFSQM